MNRTIQNDCVLSCICKCHKVVELLLMCRSASIVLSRYVVLFVLFMRIPVGVYTYCEVIHIVLHPVKYSYFDDECWTYLQIFVFIFWTCSLSAYNIHQGCTNSCGSSAWNLLLVTFFSSVILRWLSNFCEICVILIHAVIFALIFCLRLPLF
jgi:hypothetical protein